METILNDIIAADKAARKRVQQKKVECLHIQHQVDEKKAEIKAKYEQENAALIEAKKQAFEADKEKAQAVAKQDFDSNVQKLRKIYAEHKDAWIQTIYDRCIHE